MSQVEPRMTPREFMDKCVWEGGDLISGFEYGLGPVDLDNSDPEFKKLIVTCYEKWTDFKYFADLIHERYDFDGEEN
jgi:hypothetical protein